MALLRSERIGSGRPCPPEMIVFYLRIRLAPFQLIVLKFFPLSLLLLLHQIVSIRAEAESIEVEAEALTALGKIGAKTSLR